MKNIFFKSIQFWQIIFICMCRIIPLSSNTQNTLFAGFRLSLVSPSQFSHLCISSPPRFSSPLHLSQRVVSPYLFSASHHLISALCHSHRIFASIRIFSPLLAFSLFSSPLLASPSLYDSLRLASPFLASVRFSVSLIASPYFKTYTRLFVFLRLSSPHRGSSPLLA